MVEGGEMTTAAGYETEILIPGGHGSAFPVARGQFLEIVDVEGQQVADFVAFAQQDRREPDADVRSGDGEQQDAPGCVRESLPACQTAAFPGLSCISESYRRSPRSQRARPQRRPTA